MWYMKNMELVKSKGIEPVTVMGAKRDFVIVMYAGDNFNSSRKYRFNW